MEIMRIIGVALWTDRGLVGLRRRAVSYIITYIWKNILQQVSCECRAQRRNILLANRQQAVRHILWCFELRYYVISEMWQTKTTPTQHINTYRQRQKWKKFSSNFINALSVLYCLTQYMCSHNFLPNNQTNNNQITHSFTHSPNESIIDQRTINASQYVKWSLPRSSSCSSVYSPRSVRSKPQLTKQNRYGVTSICCSVSPCPTSADRGRIINIYRTQLDAVISAFPSKHIN